MDTEYIIAIAVIIILLPAIFYAINKWLKAGKYLISKRYRSEALILKLNSKSIKDNALSRVKLAEFNKKEYTADKAAVEKNVNNIFSAKRAKINDAIKQGYKVSFMDKIKSSEFSEKRAIKKGKKYLKKEFIKSQFYNSEKK